MINISSVSYKVIITFLEDEVSRGKVFMGFCNKTDIFIDFFMGF